MAHWRVPALAAATIVVSEVERRPSAPALVPIAHRHVYIYISIDIQIDICIHTHTHTHTHTYYPAYISISTSTSLHIHIRSLSSTTPASIPIAPLRSVATAGTLCTLCSGRAGAEAPAPALCAFRRTEIERPRTPAEEAQHAVEIAQAVLQRGA